MHLIQHVARVSNWRGLAMLGLLSFAGVAAHAQTPLNYGVSLAQNVTGTYTDLGTTGAAITTANTDDDNSAPQSIGFSFSYNGQSFTQFVLNTNGFVRLGANAPSATALFTPAQDPSTDGPVNSTNANDVDLLMPFSQDLEAGTGTGGAEFRVATTGTAPNRVCTIQWKNMSDKTMGAVPKQYANISFQVKLYETTNVVEFVYSAATAATGTAAPKYLTVGLKGSGKATSQIVLATKGSAQAWSAATFQNTAYLDPTLGNAFNIRNGVLPDAGRTLRFTPLFPNDAEVQAIYSLGKLPQGLSTPHTVQVSVRNAGVNTLSGVPVTLSATGANPYSNTQVISSLASGASTTVSFTPYSPANLGNSTLTVSVLPDDQNSNNSKTFTQTVTSNLLRAAENVTTSSSSVGFNTTSTGVASGALLARHTISAARNVTAVNAQLEDSRSVGRTLFAVVTNAAGVVQGRSADYVVQSTDIGTLKTFTLNAPVTIPAGGTFLIGIVQGAASGTTQYFPLGVSTEVPTRPGTFFTIAPFGTTGGTPADAGSANLGGFLLDAVLTSTTGVSKELEAAVNVYPNPSSNGQFTLELRGANAKGNLQVEVTNLLGQRVYSGSAKDNFENRLDLSQLANGLYTLKLSLGDQYMTRTISIRK